MPLPTALWATHRTRVIALSVTDGVGIKFGVRHLKSIDINYGSVKRVQNVMFLNFEDRIAESLNCKTHLKETHSSGRFLFPWSDLFPSGSCHILPPSIIFHLPTRANGTEIETKDQHPKGSEIMEQT